MPLILPSNSISAGGYEVDNSLRFDGASSDYLSRTFGASGNTKTFTFSFWVKKCEFATNPDTMSDAQMLFGGQQSGYPAFNCLFLHTNDTIFIKDAQNTNDIQLSIKTEMQFRDPSAWYHIVFAVDTTQATESDRAKLYVNGVLQTALDGENASGGATDTPLYPPQNTDLQFNSNEAHYINKYATNYEDMYMSEFVFIDGQQLTATSFGEFDSATGIWKPIDVSGLTFGTNGLYLDFKNSGSLGADVSGNGNNFTVNNLTSIDQTTDTPTNNFCTWNPLVPPAASNHTFSNGNTTITGTTAANVDTIFSTFAVSAGKWYCEMKLTQEGNATSSVPNFGIGSTADFKNAPDEAYYDTSGVNLYVGRVNNTQINHNGSAEGTSFSTAYDVGDIAGLALDLDSGTKTLKFYLNGTLNATININADEYCFICAVKRDDNDAQVDANFGNPPYSISSGNSDENGYGNFEYAVPSGYYALNTKNLAEYG